MKLTGSQILAEVLLEHGVDTIFGYPGGAVLNIYDTLYDYRDRIKHILTAHEQGASHAADGYARATGKTGVVLATSGPGATNLVTGIATAYMDSIPMVAITGNVSTSLLGKDSFQEIYITGITMPITKHNFLVRDVADLADVLRKAFQIANSGRKGPVLVDIPKDVTGAKCEFVPAAPLPADQLPYHKDEEALQMAADLINKAHQPVIYFGGGVTLSDASEELKALMKKANIPATHTMMAAGQLRYDDPLNIGLLGMHGSKSANKSVSNADLVIAVGARFSDRVALNPKKFAPKSNIIHIDIDASEFNKNVLVDCSISGDVKAILNDLLPLVAETTHEDWLKRIQKWRDTDYKPKDSEKALKPHQLLRKVAEMTPEDTVFVTDVGQHQMWAAQYLHHCCPRSFITSGGLGTMGFGYGASIGARIGLPPEKRVIHITGDGSFHMNLNEAATAVSYNLPIITIIMDNSVLGMVYQWQTAFYGKRYASTVPDRKTDFARLADAFGAKGFRAANLAEFEDAMKQALKEKGPVWIDCAINKEERVLPMIPAGGTIEDTIME